MIQAYLKELELEAQTTRKMLLLIPDDEYDYKPHQKSMPMHTLAVHIAELPTWITLTLHTDELDFASSPYMPTVVNNNAELLDLFEKAIADGRASLEAATDEQLEPQWMLRTGSNIHYSATKGDMIRVSLSQIIHHRAQLGVYLRLLNIPIPGSYGPSADEMEMMAAATEKA